MPKDTAPVVPPRNDPKPLEPYARSRSLELAGLNPDFVHQWFRRDEIADKTRAHEIGAVGVGFLMVDAWEVVDTTMGVTNGRARDDAGKPVDTTVTNGDLVLLRTTKENYEKYEVIGRKRDELIDQRLAGGQAHNFGFGTSFKTRTAGGRASLDAAPTKILEGV